MNLCYLQRWIESSYMHFYFLYLLLHFKGPSNTKKSKACFNILRPGIVNTKLIGSENDKINKDYSASTYSGTYTKIEDITKAILFLHSTSISGINLDLSDGLRFN